jgi:hypothetical protein
MSKTASFLLVAVLWIGLAHFGNASILGWFQKQQEQWKKYFPGLSKPGNDTTNALAVSAPTGVPLMDDLDMQLFKGDAEYAVAAKCPHVTETLTYHCETACRRNITASDSANVFIVELLQDPKANSMGYVAMNHAKGEIAVAFRGSANVNDWLYNLDFKMERSDPIGPPDVMVHSGFKRAYLAVGQRMVDTLVKVSNEHPSYQILITGHSLGGGNSHPLWIIPSDM